MRGKFPIRILQWNSYDYLNGEIVFFLQYFIQHCFICRPSNSTVYENAGIEPRTFATSALSVRRSNHSARSRQHSARSHPQKLLFGHIFPNSNMCIAQTFFLCYVDVMMSPGPRGAINTPRQAAILELQHTFSRSPCVAERDPLAGS